MKNAAARHYPPGSTALRCSTAAQAADHVRHPYAARQDFAFGRNGYHLRIVPPQGELRNEVDQLIGRMYSGRGLATYSAPTTQGKPLETTLVACKGDRPFGTITIGVDKGHGLLADTLYNEQIDGARRQGAKVCEFTRFAMDPEHGTQEAMAAIFNVGFLLARFAHRMTDIFVEVHPRHTAYYRRALGYRVAGPNLTCPRVGAPAVLMHLPLSHAETEAMRLGGTGHPRSRNLYELFFSPSEQQQVLESLLAPAT